MSRFKVVFASRSAAPCFKGGTVYAAATLPGKPPIVASKFVDRDATSDAGEMLREAAREVLRLLLARLPREHEITTYMSCESDFGSITVNAEGSLVGPDQIALRVFVIPPEAAPKELKRALEAVDAHQTARLAQMKIEYPMLPWVDAIVGEPGAVAARCALSADASAHIEVLKRYGDLGIYDTAHPELAAAWTEITRRKRMLLHVCCGPDAAGVINQLKRDFDLTCFWYDPNIQPREEHDKRLEAFQKVAEIEQVDAIIGEYDVERFFDKIKGLEHTPEQGAKCSSCYDMRLERAAREANEKNFDLYATTLAISPHKVQQKLIAFGELNEKKFGVPYYHRNFMQDDGFKRSVELTEQYDIYRQDYCGCLFSMHEGGADARAKAASLGLMPRVTPST